ncbi:hypothetical protein ABZW32_06610 [Streptomyces sp. NPDC004667]|uniref:hypothetical protein n=1 Tax=Streptomyces sp. NPDC004667 TaxID=3154285 RepID=UPI0033AB3175
MRTGSRTALALALCASAATALAGCGGPARDGYVALGAAAPGPERGAGENVAPRGGVEFQALPPGAGSSVTSPGPSGDRPGGSSAPGGATATPPGGSADGPGIPPGAGTPTVPDPSGGAGTSGTGTGGTPGSGSTGGSGSGGSGSTGGSGGSGSTGGSGGSPTPPAPPGTKPGTPPPPTPSPPPATPARLTLSAPARAAASERWCERVTVTFTNTGSTAARSGTVTFATHVIGALGIDWATVTTSQPLPAPIAGGTSKTQTYTVCVESWRVPLGMHVDTRNVTATYG